ncbi:hypothetical protein ACRAWD_02185 [Caulobacter segnis]
MFLDEPCAARPGAHSRLPSVQDSPMAGVRFVETLMTKFEQIAFSPFMAQAVASNPRFRRLPQLAPYVIFYE